MLERRRSSYGRALVGGAMLGVTAAVPLIVCELAAALISGSSGLVALDSVRFFVVIAALPIGAGAILGILEGLLFNSAALLTEKLAAQRLAQPRWMARISCVMVSPAIAFFVAELFSRVPVALPARHLLAVGAGVASVVTVYVLARLVVAVRDRFRIRRWDGRHARVLAPLLLSLSLFFFVADRAFFGRLSPAIHGFFVVFSVVWAQLAMATIYSAYRPLSRLMGRLFEPRLVAMVLVGAVAIGAIGLSQLRRSEPVRVAIGRSTAVSAQLMTLCGHVGLLPPDASTDIK